MRAFVLAVLITGCSGSEQASPPDAATPDAEQDGPIAIFPSCADGVRNGAESDTDCGGGECAPCTASKVCNSSDDCAGVCRSGNCAYAASCAERKRPTARSGVYELDIDGDGPESPLPFYCDMETEGGGYTLVYKISSGVASSPASMWTSSEPLNDADRALLTVGKSAKSYVSRLVTKHWNLEFKIAEVRVSLVVGGKEAKFFRFDGKGSSVVNWFDGKRILSSSYSDTGATMMTNIFSILGDPSSHREWLISRNYGGCEVDAGWVVADWAPDPCMWESAHPATRILYAPGDGATTWVTGGALADALLVYVR